MQLHSHRCYKRVFGFRSERLLSAPTILATERQVVAVTAVRAFSGMHLASQNLNFAQNPDASHTGNLGAAHRVTDGNASAARF